MKCQHNYERGCQVTKADKSYQSGEGKRHPVVKLWVVRLLDVQVMDKV